MSEYLHTLVSKFDQQGITPLMAGGWAVNHFGFTRATKDIDFVFSKDDREVIISTMEASGFNMFSDSNIATRFQHREIYLPVVDAIWVNSLTHEKMMLKSEASKAMPKLHYLALEHLLAMKLHALHDHDDRQGKDLEDIKQLIKVNSQSLDKETLIETCEKYAPAWAKEELFKK